MSRFFAFCLGLFFALALFGCASPTAPVPTPDVDPLAAPVLVVRAYAEGADSVTIALNVTTTYQARRDSSRTEGGVTETVTVFGGVAPAADTPVVVQATAWRRGWAATNVAALELTRDSTTVVLSVDGRLAF